MSRTIKGAKGVGYEYWSRRNRKWVISPGRATKQLTNRFERRKRKQEVHED